MSVEDNKKVALAVIEGFSSKRVEDAFKLFSADATWWYPHSMPGGGIAVPAEVMKQNLLTFVDTIANFRLEPIGVTAEGNRVAVEIQGHGTMNNGAQYNNTYHMLYIVEGGKVRAVREYADTLLISKILSIDVKTVN